MKYLWRLVGLALGILAIVFAVSNRAPVSVSLWPLPWTIAIPIYVLVFIALALGVVAGGFGAWRAGGKHRRRARDTRRQADALSEENETLRQAARPGAAALPARR